MATLLKGKCKKHDLTDFYAYGGKPVKCRACSLERKKTKAAKEYDKQWYKDNKERLIEYGKDYREKRQKKTKKNRREFIVAHLTEINKLLLIYEEADYKPFELESKVDPNRSQAENIRRIRGKIRRRAKSKIRSKKQWSLIPIYLWRHRTDRFRDLPQSIKDELYLESKKYANEKIKEYDRRSIKRKNKGSSRT